MNFHEQLNIISSMRSLKDHLQGLCRVNWVPQSPIELVSISGAPPLILVLGFIAATEKTLDIFILLRDQSFLVLCRVLETNHHFRRFSYLNILDVILFNCF